MLKQLKRTPLVLSIILSLVSIGHAEISTPDHLSLEGFLDQVKEKNLGVRGDFQASESGKLRSDEAALLLSPTFFANVQYSHDGKLVQPLFITYDSQSIAALSVGISQTTDFGLQAKLRYDLSTQGFNNPVISPSLSGMLQNSSGPSLLNLATANASPILELTQSLWSNGFGRTTRATQDLNRAQALSASYGSSYAAKVTVSQAESAYWRLALARETVSVEKGALKRAKKIYDWSVRREKLHLAEESDVLQSEASLQSRQLELTSALNAERTASLAFNSARNMDSDQVPEALAPIVPETMNQIQVPHRAQLRDDVKAAQEKMKVEQASATLALERDLPTLDLYATLALNGQGANAIYPNLGGAIPASFTFNRPTETIGVRFSMPLDVGLAVKSRDGWKQEKVASELIYDRKLFDQEHSWKNLNLNFNQTKEHLDLSQKLERIQEVKLNVERARLQKGRSTTFQVLQFETDYLLAQLTRIRDQAMLLDIVAQMKVFGETL